MVRYRRNFVPGATYFFTATLADRRSDSLIRHIGVLRNAFRSVRRAHPFAIGAIVILPDHLHVVITLPENDAGYAKRWMLLKRRFTEGVLKKEGHLRRHRIGEFALWQRRYWEHTIRDERDYESHVDYIHFNPVKHGLVTQVRDWPYSSFHNYVRRGVLPEDWGGGVSTSERLDFGER